MSHHMSPGPVDDPQYATLNTLTRCIHFNDFEHCYNSKRMNTHTIKLADESWLYVEALWFGPSLSTTYDHNWYGNVSFIVNMDAVISRFGDKFYYIDKQEFTTRSASRLLLTNKWQDELTPVDINKPGAPLMKNGWRYEYVSRCKSGRFGWVMPHHLEIAIEADFNDCEWLYKTCSVEANNHSQANTDMGFGSNTCHRYNTFNKTCPYKLSRDGVQTKLDTLTTGN